MKKSAFTLVEMLIAITVFTIFMGMALGSFLTFHRAQQEAAVSRTVVFEAENVLAVLTAAIKENAISYEDYSDDSDSSVFDFSRLFSSMNLSGADSTGIETDTLVLDSPDGSLEIEYAWDEDEKILTVQEFEIDSAGERTEVDGYQEPLPLHADGVSASYVNFTIVPGEDPYDPENIIDGDDSLWFQPHVKIELEFSAPGKVRETVTLDLKSSVTSRIYQ